jgi:hypothetical protein
MGGHWCGEHRRLADVGLDPCRLAIGADRDGTMFVSTKDTDAQGIIALEDSRL